MDHRREFSSGCNQPVIDSRLSQRVNRTKDEFARYTCLASCRCGRNLRGCVHTYYRSQLPVSSVWRVHVREAAHPREGSPAYLGLARSRATSYVTHNSTNSITKFEVIPPRQPGCRVPSCPLSQRVPRLRFLQACDKLLARYLPGSCANAGVPILLRCTRVYSTGLASRVSSATFLFFRRGSFRRSKLLPVIAGKYEIVQRIHERHSCQSCHNCRG